MKQCLVPSVLLLFILSTYQHKHGLVPEQPDYNCFEKDPEPVDTAEEFLDYCKDYAGNVHYEFANLTSCCECIRYECINFGELNEQKYYFWNKSISEHCCLHCDGTVYKADTIIETVVEKDECGTIKTAVCRKNDGGIANIEIDFTYESCCNDGEGILPIGEIKLEPSTCSKRTCEYSASSQHSSWISTQILPGCNCCVVDGKLVPDGYSWFIDRQEYECCEGKIVSVVDSSGSGDGNNGNEDWIKVFSHNTDGGLFTSPEDALSKNVDDPSAELYSILGQLEEYKSEDGFHFRLCYPELVGVNDGDGCNEWIQTSNPATDSTITGFKNISISFPYDSYMKDWHGIGKDITSKYLGAFIDDSPKGDYFWTSIGAYQYHGSASTIPGPYKSNISSENQYLVKKVELYVTV